METSKKRSYEPKDDRRYEIANKIDTAWKFLNVTIDRRLNRL